MRTTQVPSRLAAVLLALIVVTLWSSSWVLIKLGLQDIPPLTFAGLRYIVAFLAVLPLSLTASSRRALGSLNRRSWLLLGALGLTLYGVGVGGQFVALVYLPTVTTRLLYAFNTIVVALLAGALLREPPTRVQWCGVLVAMLGIYTYFYPVDIPTSELTGVASALIGMVGFGLGTLLGRDVARAEIMSPVLVTSVSMGVGGTVLLGCGVALQGLPPISLGNWLMILWLGVVITALTFVLWNHSLRTLTAVEANIITNIMIVEIAILGWVFLGEHLSLIDVAGLGLVIAGTIMVQLRRKAPDGSEAQESN
jgi:drug/metabolite transporter (DMT)-like permease